MSVEDLTSEEIFNTAREKTDPADRARYLDGACGNDVALRAKVEALLEADVDAGGFLEDVRERLQAVVTEDIDPRAAEPSVPGEKAGDEIGRYKLLQQIGEGGFGSVWMAEQRDPVRRQVALKIIKLGMDTKEVVARFEVERQALALMDHPNICKVLDAGSTNNGRPYFVMELVKGVPISDYCDGEHLSSKERLQLFVRICKAVQHAHQKGIIHRDLKPSNVLVTLHDGAPVPKVIDFGIAKATNRELTEKTLFTEYRQFLGTPEYMSPEQAEMSGLDIDTRSDVYSLGVLLYELLTGVTPFDPGTLRSAALNEVRRIIREEEPPTPSVRLSTLRSRPARGARREGIDRGDSHSESASPQSIAKRRSTDVSTLLRSLRGDLDWIVMKALEKKRDRRYATVDGFAKDVERHLNNEPVTACPPSTAYRIRKFVARNRASMTAAALVFLVLLAGALGTSYGLIRALDAERTARTERDEARRQTESAEAVNDFLTHHILAVVAPSGATGSGRDVKMLDVLDVASKQIDRAAGVGGSFAGKPLVEASVQSTIGQTYLHLGEYAEAEPRLERALELRQQELGKESHETVLSVMHLGLLRTRQGRYEEAESLLLGAVETTRSALEAENELLTQCLHAVAYLYMDLARYPEAERHLEEALAIRAGEGHVDSLLTADLARLYAEQGRFDEAEALYERIPRIRGGDLPSGERDSQTLLAMKNLAAVYVSAAHFTEPRERTRRLDKAETLVLETRELMKRYLGEEHPSTLHCANLLAAVYLATQRPAEAEDLCKRNLQVLERKVGENHRSVLWVKSMLARAYFEQDRRTEARRLLEQTLASQKVLLGEGHPDTLSTMDALSLVLNEEGKLTEATRLLERAVELSTPDTDARQTRLERRHILGELYMRRGLYREAEALYLQVIPLLKETFGGDHRRTLGAITNLGLVYNLMERFDDARAQFEKSLALQRVRFGLQDPSTRLALGGLANAYDGLGRTEDSMPLQRELLESLSQAAKAPDADASTLNQLAGDLLTFPEELRDPERALRLARRASKLEAEAGGADLWGYLATLALAERLTGRTARAVETQKRALSLVPEGASESDRARLEANLKMFEAALASSSLENSRSRRATGPRDAFSAAESELALLKAQLDRFQPTLKIPGRKEARSRRPAARPGPQKRDPPSPGSRPPGRLLVSILNFEVEGDDADSDHWGALLGRLVGISLGEAESIQIRAVSDADRRRADLEAGEPVDEKTARALGEVVRTQRVVWGKCRRLQDAWEVEATVLNVATGETSKDVVRSTGDWFELRDQLLERILERLGAGISAEELAAICWPRTDSREALLWFSRANALYADGRPSTEQETAARKAVRADPSFPPARLLLAIVLGSRGKTDEALEEARAAIELRHKYAAAHRTLGLLLLSNGEFSSAEEAVRESLILAPHSPDSCSALAIILVSRREFTEASRAAQEGVRLAPTDASLHALLGLIRALAGDREGALAALQAAESLGAEDTATLARLAESYASLREPSRAIPFYEKCIEKGLESGASPERVDRLRRRLDALKERLTPTFIAAEAPRSYTEEELEAELRRRLEGDELPPEAAGVLRANGPMREWARRIVQGLDGELDQGRAIFRVLSRRTHPGSGGRRTAVGVFEAWGDPDTLFSCKESARLFVALARCVGLRAFYVNLKRDSGNRDYYHSCALLFAGEKALLVDPEDQWFGAPHRDFSVLDDIQAIAFWLFQPAPDAKPADQLEVCRLASKLDPDSLLGKLAMASALTEVEQYGRASRILDEIEKLEPDRRNIVLARGWIAFRTRDFQSAEELLKEAIARNSNHPQGYLLLGKTLVRLEKYSEARDAYRQALALGLTDALATSVRREIVRINELIGID